MNSETENKAKQALARRRRETAGQPLEPTEEELRKLEEWRRGEPPPAAETETAAKEATIWAQYIAVQSELSCVPRDRENPYFKSNYATMEALDNMLKPILKKHGLGYLQSVAFEGERVVMKTTVFNAEGETLCSCVPFGCKSNMPQDIGSAITYSRRYGLQAAFGVVIAFDETDDDGNRAQGLKAVQRKEDNPF